VSVEDSKMSKKAADDLTETVTEQPKRKQNIEEGLTLQQLYNFQFKKFSKR
jgi:hypothetical protein